MTLDLDALERLAHSNPSRTVPGVYYSVLISGNELAELVFLARLGQLAIDKDAACDDCDRYLAWCACDPIDEEARS